MRKFVITIILALILGVIGACGANTEKKLSAEEKSDKQIEDLIKGMTLPEKVGQMVMIGVAGTDTDENNLYMLHQYHIGGIIFFDRNMEDPTQVKNFIDKLQKNADEKVPLFIAIDEEGGRVARMKDKLPPPPSAQEIGAEGLAAARQYGEETAKKLKDLGFNVNFAPVADIGLGNRSFGTDKDTVTDFVRETAAGYEKGKILYSFKHFPGIGKGSQDSHIGTSIVSADKEEIFSEDMAPFQSMIAEKNHDDFFIMISHVSYPALDKDLPASLSHVIQTELLRERLGYKGIIITDDLEMGAITERFGFEEAAVMAIEAGADIALVCHEYPHQREAYLAILDAVEKGRIKESRIDESLRRILHVKLKHLSR